MKSLLIAIFLSFCVTIHCTFNEDSDSSDHGRLPSFYDIQNRFVGYTFAADNVLSGNTSTAALNELMDFFSAHAPDFIWGDIRNPNGLPYSEVRSQYYNLATTVYDGFSCHTLPSMQITPSSSSQGI